MLSGFLRMLWENLLSPSSGIQEYPEKCVKKKNCFEDWVVFSCWFYNVFPWKHRCEQIVQSVEVVTDRLCMSCPVTLVRTCSASVCADDLGGTCLCVQVIITNNQCERNSTFLSAFRDLRSERVTLLSVDLYSASKLTQNAAFPSFHPTL